MGVIVTERLKGTEYSLRIPQRLLRTLWRRLSWRERWVDLLTTT